MSLALGKNSVNVNQPLHLDNTNHLLVNDSTNKAVLEQIATNTANISVNVDSLEVNTDGLEALQATTNTTLAAILVDTDAADSSLNTIEAQSVLTASRLNNIQNKISANTDGTGDTLGQIASNILTKNTAAEVHLGNVETKLGTIETDIELTNTKLDSIISNTAAIVIDGDAIQVNTDGLEALVGSTNTLLTQLDVVADNSLAKLGTIETDIESTNTKLGTIETDIETTNTLLTQLDVVADNSLVKLTEIDTAIDTIDTVLDASLVKQTNIETLLTAGNVDHAANEVLLTALVNDLAGIEIINAASEAHLGNIDNGVDVLEACVGSNKVNVNISSGNISGFATSALQGDIETSLDALIAANHTDLVALETSLTSMESKQDTMIGHQDGVETILTAIDGRVDGLEGLQGTANTHLSEIEGAVETLEACVGSNKVNVNISSGNISGFATQTTLAAAEVHLGNIETSVQLIDDIALAEDAAHSSGQKGVMFLGVRQSSQADFAADGDYTPLSIDDDGKLRVTSSAASGGSTEAKQDTIISHVDGIEALLSTIDADTGAIKTAVEILDNAISGNEMQVDVLTLPSLPTGSNTIGTVNLSATDNAVLDAIKIDTEAIETAVEILSASQTKEVTQLLFGSGNNVANGTPESSSNSIELKNNGSEEVAVFVTAENSDFACFIEYSPTTTDADFVTDNNIALGNPTICDSVKKKGKFMRIKIRNDSGTTGTANAFVVKLVQ